MKCALNILWKKGQGRQFVLGEFRRLFPDHQLFFAHPITDDKIIGRADTGTRAGYESEWPDKDPATAIYMPAAERIVELGEPVSAAQVLEYCAGVTRNEAEITPVVTMPVQTIIAPITPTIAPAAVLIGFETAINSNPKPPEPTVVQFPTPAPDDFSHLFGHTNGREVFWTPDQLMNYGIHLTGDPGAGKTSAIKALTADAAAAGFPVLAFHFKGDATDYGLVRYDINSLKLPINPLNLVPDAAGEVIPIGHATEIAGILQRTFGLGPIQAAQLKDAIATVYQNAGIAPRLRHRLIDLPAAPSWADVVAVLEQDSDNRALLARLAPISDLGLFPPADLLPIEDLFDGQVVIDLALLPSDQIKAAIAEFLIVRLHHHLLHGDQPRKFRRLVVVDEAHRLSTSERLIELGREGREFGIGFAVASQFCGDLPLELTGCLETKIALFNGEDQHRRAAAKMVASTGWGFNMVRDQLGRLRKHQAIIRNAEIPSRQVDLVPHYKRPVPAAAE
jgi:hypothetical protein